MNEELKLLDEAIPSLTSRADYDRSLRLCIDNAFEIHEQIASKICNDTKTTAHCYFLKPNRQNNSYIENLVKTLMHNILGYTIPRKEIEKAEKVPNSIEELLKLYDEAKAKYVDYWKKRKEYLESQQQYKSGEGGETLLFLIIEQILGLPQAICKMNLKTSFSMHYHGADGIHIGLTEDKSKLALYYGESKVYKEKSSAVKDCLESIENLILNKNDEEELSILNSYCDLGKANEELVEKLVDYFRTDNYKNNELVELRGVCLVGFEKPEIYNDKAKIAENISKQSQAWLNSFSKKAKELNLEEIVLNVFFIPFPSIEEFRKAFADELGG